MKKIISIMLAFTMVFTLSACGNSGTSGAQDNTVPDASEEVQNNIETASSEETETAGQQTAGNGNVLIAYLSFPMDEGVDAVATASRTQYEDGTLGNTNFLEGYDLSGKTIVPFCTSGGNDVEISMDFINEASKGATVLEGITANYASDDAIEQWLERIGMAE